MGRGGGYKISDSVDRKFGVSIMDIVIAMNSSIKTESTGTKYFSEEKAAEVNAVVTEALSKILITTTFNGESHPVVNETGWSLN